MRSTWSFSLSGRTRLHWLVLPFLLTSCGSGTAQIASSTNAVALHAQAIQSDSRELTPYVAEEGVPHLLSIESHAGEILRQADKTRLALTKVKDTTPWWADLLSTWGQVLLAGAICFLLVYLGVGPLIRRGLLLLGSFFPVLLPSSTRTEAELARTQIEESPTPAVHSAVTLRRAKDPYFDAAYKGLRRKQKKAKRRAERQAPESLPLPESENVQP